MKEFTDMGDETKQFKTLQASIARSPGKVSKRACSSGHLTMQSNPTTTGNLQKFNPSF